MRRPSRLVEKKYTLQSYSAQKSTTNFSFFRLWRKAWRVEVRKFYEENRLFLPAWEEEQLHNVEDEITRSSERVHFSQRGSARRLIKDEGKFRRGCGTRGSPDRRLRLLYWLVRVVLIKRSNYPGKILSEISVINFRL